MKKYIIFIYLYLLLLFTPILSHIIVADNSHQFFYSLLQIPRKSTYKQTVRVIDISKIIVENLLSTFPQLELDNSVVYFRITSYL